MFKLGVRPCVVDVGGGGFFFFGIAIFIGLGGS
jgi:hypothetical protein